MTSSRNLSDAARDFIVELASEEARTVIPSLSFTLHEVVESRRRSSLLIEGNHPALVNLAAMFKANCPYRVEFRRYR